MNMFKKIFSILLTFLCMISLSSCKNNNIIDEDVLERSKKNSEIVWGVKYDTKLFCIMNVKTREVEGFDIDIAKAITKEILGENSSAKFVEATLKTRIPLLKNGNIDAIVSTMTINDERKKQVDFSDIYFSSGQSLLVKKESYINDIKDLNENTVILAIKGSTSAINIAKKAPKSKILELDNYTEAFIALESGQGDVMTTDNIILFGILKESPSYRIVDCNFFTDNYGIAVNKNQENFLNEINRALKELHKNGTYDKIYKKWFD